MLRRIFSCLAVFALVGAGLTLLPIAPASGGAGAAVTVDTTEDDGSLSDCLPAVDDDCSLRGALEVVADTTNPVDITVPAGTYPLLDEIRVFQANVNVHGAGIDETIVTTDLSENLLVRHLELDADENPVSVVLSDMTFSDGAQGSAGGSIRADAGVDLTILRMFFADNAVRGNGGAISVTGVQADQTLIVEDTTFAGNTATEYGGAIHVGDEESAIISNSTFTGNGAGAGGALAVGDDDVDTNAEAHLNFVTMSGNVSAGLQDDAPTSGGSIFVSSGSEVQLEASILEASEEGTVEAPGEPVAAAVGDPSAECFIAEGAVLESGGHNVVDDDSCEIAEDTDQPETAAGAQALADNGGPTYTMALLADSPAVDAGGATCDLADDQRGIARPQDGNADDTVACDSGAYERAAAPPAAQPAAEVPTFTG